MFTVGQNLNKVQLVDPVIAGRGEEHGCPTKTIRLFRAMLDGSKSCVRVAKVVEDMG